MTYYIDKVGRDRKGWRTYHLVYKTTNRNKAFDYFMNRLYEKGHYVFDASDRDNVYLIGATYVA